MTTTQIVTTALASIFLITLGVMLFKSYMKKLKSDPMTPYAIAVGNNWFTYNYRKQLTKNIEDGSYFENLKLEADMWCSCPCANLPQCIQRDDMGIPIDSELQMLGHNFSEQANKLIKLHGVRLSVAQEEMISLLRLIELRGKILAGQEIAKHNELRIMKINQNSLGLN